MCLMVVKLAGTCSVRTRHLNRPGFPGGSYL